MMADVASLIPEEITDWAFSAVMKPMFSMTNANAAAVITKATRIIAVSIPVIPRRLLGLLFILCVTVNL
jgi:hypothetical protein